ncbi:hypothetical protein EHS25_000760 [Saitozyma podzolica]|uniref:Uncharacterized protein n=1 Tax=Saitozyma podzolica TaxID=1890683 RepID=A0A427YX56_9TREE|nr:hypothetical protein EHS25_000760 [Saitozyma podzolica]
MPRGHPLPHLLSLLPRSGRSALVRPTTWPETSFYQITRTKLKFRPTGSASASASASASGSTPSEGQESGAAMTGTEGGLKAHGKAWGLMFWDGKYTPPTSPLALPATEIRKALKRSWVSVDPSTLPASVQDELRKSTQRVKEGEEGRRRVIRERREARAGRLAERSAGERV